MAIIQISKIQHRTGNIYELPQLSVGEIGYAIDAKRVFIGNDPDVLGPSPDNTELLTQYSDINAAGTDTEIQFNQAGIFGASSNFAFDYANSNLNLDGNLSVTQASTFGNTVTVNGNLNVSGNITYYDIVNTRTSDPIIDLGGGPNGTPLTGNDGKDRGTLLNYFTSMPMAAFMGWDNSNGEFAFGSNVTNLNDVITFNQLGNVRARTFIGNVVGNVSGNIIGNVSVPGSTGQILFNNSGNIDAGANFSISGNVVTVVGTVTANFFSGNGSNLSALAGANVTGSVANATYANIAGIAYSVSGANVSGSVANATYANIAGIAYSVSGANVSGSVANATYANISGVAYSVSGANVSGQVANALVAGTVYTAAQPNITSLGTLTSLSVSGNIVSTNFTTGANSTSGTITGNWTLSSGSQINATYADLAEYYMPDQKYAAGTVLAFGGRKEVTISTSKNYQKIAGVVSENPAYAMNTGIADKGSCIALVGRVPVKVVGKIEKGDLLRASAEHEGVAVNTGDGGVIGRAIQKYNSEQVGLIEVMVGRT
jgi:hypothetical protein